MNLNEKIKIKTLIKLLEKYSGKKVILEIKQPQTPDETQNILIRLLKLTNIKNETTLTKFGNVLKISKREPNQQLQKAMEKISVDLDKYGFARIKQIKKIKGERYLVMKNDLNIIVLLPL